MKILLIDDEENLCLLVQKFLEINDYEVFVAKNGYEGIDSFKKNQPNLVILDLNLPDMYGVEICKAIRKETTNVPICMLSANMDTESIVDALNEGADDYLTKPFNNDELLARIKALFRRYGHLDNSTEDVFKVEDLEINLKAFEVRRSGELINLTNKEFMLLEYLFRKKDKVLTREMILQDVWNINFDTQTNIIDVHISWLRKKLDVGTKTRLIHTISGKGYMFGIL